MITTDEKASESNFNIDYENSRVIIIEELKSQNEFASPNIIEPRQASKKNKKEPK